MRNLLFFAFYLLFNPRFFKLIPKKIYIPVYIQYEWLKDLKIGTVIDVGAYRGRVSVVLNYLFPSAQIYAFEPTNEILELERLMKPNITTEHLVIGGKKSQATFYRTSYGPASSLLNFGKFYKDTFKVAEEMTVNVTTLDEYFSKKKFKKPILLKIDTQGTEGLVLKGAQKILKDVAVIHLESPIRELYKGQDFFEDLYDFLTKRNFRYVGDIPDSLFYPNFSPPEVVNCIYVNKKILDDFT